MNASKSSALVVAALSCAAFVNRAAADTFGIGAIPFDIEFVTIGNPGNPPDTTGDPNPAGSVAHAYRIGKFEISEQIIAKANTMGGLGITNSTRGPNKPATNVTWNEAARFINWLNTSTGNAPAYKFAFQPGQAGYSATANIQLWTSGDAGYDPTNRYRSSLARYFLPSVHEWYKAAYYDPTSGNYFDYPTGSNATPTSVVSGTAAGTAVFNPPGPGGPVEPADVNLAGGLSPYGTMGQGGNVWELEETDIDGVNNSANSLRSISGGSWDRNAINMHASAFGINSPADASSNIVGFRVASKPIPEPSALSLCILAALGVLARRRLL